MPLNGKNGVEEANSRNSIRQPLIGEDVLMLWQIAVSTRLHMDSWFTMVYSRYFYFVINTFHHNIAAVILSERALCYPFLLSKLFIRSHKLVCGSL